MALPLWFGGSPDAADSSESRGGVSPGDAGPRRTRARDSLEARDEIGARQSPTPTPDVELFARIHANDAHALSELARRYALRLVGVATAVLGSPDLAEDVVQEMFVALWDRRATLEMRDNPGGYLYRAVRNRALNVREHEATHRRFATAANEQATSTVATNDAERIIEAADATARLYRALEHVPPSPRQAFLLSWEGDLTYREIAQVMGITAESVRKLIYRATERLARHLPPP